VVRAENKVRGGCPGRAVASLCLFALAACSSLPQIGGATVPPDNSANQPVYRDLADIPEPPAITPQAANDMTVNSLAKDRASTAQAADNLRRQPFMQPESNTTPGF
jgi:hypothetical protein